METKIEDMNFEEALKKLEETVKILEEGKAPLDESMKYYEEGIKLVKLCSDKLNKARKKVTEVSGAEND